jgi:polyisoprenyl-phosphate glycosyltransferase
VQEASEETQITISVVVPIYGSSTILSELHRRLRDELVQIGEPFEIVYVDDCGPGGSLEVLRGIANDDPSVAVVEMLTNVGQLSATIHGIAETRGQYVVTIDDDLQQWPEDIRVLYQELITENMDLVVGRFPERKHSLFRNIGSELTRRLAVRSLPVPKNTRFSSFRIMRREVFENYFGDENLTNPMPGWMYFTAPRHREIEVRHAERSQGKSTYSFSSLVSNARPLLSGLVDFGLQFAVAVSVLQIIVALVGGGYMFVQYLDGNINSPGYTSIILLLLTIIGLLGAGMATLAQHLRSIKSLIVNKPSSLVRSVFRTEQKN